MFQDHCVLFFFSFFRHHTLAFVPSSGLVYAFGCNSHGQLGTGVPADATSPFPVKTGLLTGNFHRTGKDSNGLTSTLPSLQLWQCVSK